MHCAAAWARLLSTLITAEHKQSLALRIKDPYPCESFSFVSSPIGQLPYTLQCLRCICFRFVFACQTQLVGRGSGRAKSGGGPGGKLSHQLRNQNVAPLPSSATHPKSSSLGGSQERHGEWHQSEITKHSEQNIIFNHIQSWEHYCTINKCNWGVTTQQ